MSSRTATTSSSVTCLKILLGLFTTILCIIGACLLGGGVYSKIALGGYNDLTTMNYSEAPYVLIGIGLAILLFGFFGCYSIGQGNTCMLRTFGFVLALLFFAEVAFALVLLVYRPKIQESFDKGMDTAIKSYSQEKYKNAVNNAQSTLECCGSYNYTDYWTFNQSKEGVLPMSCCCNTTLCRPLEKNGWVDLHGKSPLDDYIYTEGCPVKVFEVVNNNFGVILGSSFGVAGFQLLGLILSCCLASSINNNKYELV